MTFVSPAGEKVMEKMELGHGGLSWEAGTERTSPKCPSPGKGTFKVPLFTHRYILLQPTAFADRRKPLTEFHEIGKPGHGEMICEGIILRDMDISGQYRIPCTSKEKETGQLMELVEFK
jgi:hypothetical protein